MISVLNFKPFERGAIKGFLDLRYHGLTIKGCRLMAGSNGLWVAFPQRQDEKNGVTQYFDLMFLTPPETEHVKRLVLAELQAQGHIQRASEGKGIPQQGRNSASGGGGLNADADDIAF